MSTTFGVETSSGELVEVAFRTSFIMWTNDLAEMLPSDTPVIPLDNTAQGIYTIGDIEDKIVEQK